MSEAAATHTTPEDLLDPFAFAAAAFRPKPPRPTVTAWAADRLGEFLWSKQREIVTALQTHRYVAVKSCHDAGKSFVSSRVGAHHLDTHEAGDAFLVSTAPTTAQVSAILWREMIRAMKKGNLAGEIVNSGYPQWKRDGELIGYGRKPADYSDSAFQGIHARYPLVIMDEAGGIPPNLYDSVDALATNEDARVLAIGNPDDPTSHFAQICKPGSGWYVIHIDGLRTPNFTTQALNRLKEQCEVCRVSGAEPLLKRLMREEGIEPSLEDVPSAIRPLLLSPLWVEERLHRWVGTVEEGKSVAAQANQSAIFTAKVRGQFPSSSSDGVIPLGWVEAAMARHDEWIANGSPPPMGQHVVGVDVARSGNDETCLALRTGHVVKELRKYRRSDTMETTGNVLAALAGLDGTAIVDVIGVGAGVVDRLLEQQVPTIAFNASEHARGVKDVAGQLGFKNARSAAWWRMRDALDPSRHSRVMLPNDELLKGDLTTPTWRMNSSGLVQVEGKDEIRKRLGRSTDSGDAVVQAFWIDAYGSPLDAADPGVVSWFDKSDEDHADEMLDHWLEGMDERMGDPTRW